MTLPHTIASSAVVALCFAALLLDRPVSAADPEQNGVEADSEVAADPLKRDFDALISEIETRQPAQSMPVETGAADTPSADLEAELSAAKIQIGILQQAVVAALAARAEAEAQLESLWRDSRSEIEELKVAQSEGTTRIAVLEEELASVKNGAPVNDGSSGEVQTAAYAPELDDILDEATNSEQAAIEPASGPTEVQLGEIHFDPGSAQLSPGAERKTLEAAEKIKSLGASKVRISGYSDSTGPANFNKHLSLQRAKSIASLLSSVGVDTEIMELEGNGEDGAPEDIPDQVSEPLNRCAGIFAMVDLPVDQAQQ
ncbi:MAG: OmpA family protein [Pseudomonadota bacterium]